MRKSKYDKMLENEHWITLGWYFWNAFCLSEGKERKLAQKRWRALTEEQRNLCEGEE